MVVYRSKKESFERCKIVLYLPTAMMSSMTFLIDGTLNQAEILRGSENQSSEFTHSMWA